jgi:DNA-binding IclR family transcriptional regulator
MTDARPQVLQTLDRGLLVLELVAAAPMGLSMAELAARVDVHRAVCYRLVATLSSHGLVIRGTDGRIRLGAQVRALALRLLPQLLTAARPVLADLAARTGMTAALSLAEGAECVATEVVEPDHTALHVAYRVGNRHPLGRGAAGLAILAARPSRPDDPDAVRLARRRGYAVTEAELQDGAVGVSVALPPSTGAEASIGVVTLGAIDEPVVVEQVQAAARRLIAGVETGQPV